MSSLRERFVRPALWSAGLLAAVAAVAWLLLPWPLAYRWRDPEATSFMRYRERQAEEEGRAAAVRHEWVSLNDISPAVLRAVVAAEDSRFRDHGGVDWVALGEEVHYRSDDSFSWLDPRDLGALRDAVLYAWEHRAEIRGRSTITQQLAKNLYFTPERTLGRKAAELVVAWRLEWFLSKDRILELYLNTVELGPGLFGVEAAAREYFGTSASSLGTWEAASLAATLPHPLTSNPGHRPSRMAWRRDLILQRLRAPGSGDRSPVPAAPPEPPEPAPPGDPAAPGDTVAPPDTAAPIPPDTVAAPDTVAPPDTAAPAPPDTVARPDTVTPSPDPAAPPIPDPVDPPLPPRSPDPAAHRAAAAAARAPVPTHPGDADPRRERRRRAWSPGRWGGAGAVHTAESGSGAPPPPADGRGSTRRTLHGGSP